MDTLLESWNDPHSRHAMLVHLPIVLGTLGVVPLLALAWTGFKSDRLKWTIAACFLVASAGSLLAANAGQAAADRIERVWAPLSPLEREVIAQHERRGERAWIWPLIPAALVLATLSARRSVRLGAGTLAAAAACAVAVWMGVIGHAGGRLVYAHGLGVPERTMRAERDEDGYPVVVKNGSGEGEPDRRENE